MKPHLKKLTALLLACMMVPMTVFADPEPSISDLRQEKQEAEEELEDLEDSLEDVVAELNQLEQDLVDKGEEIIEAQEELEEAEADEEEQYDEMCIRIQYMYETGSSGFLSVLFDADDFSDFLNKAEYVSNIESYDHDQLQKYIEIVEKVKVLKQKLEDERAELEEKEDEYQAKQDELDAMIEEKESDISDLEEQIEEAVRKAEEEARKKREEEEAAARAAAQAASSGNVAVSSYGNGTSQYQCENDNEKAQKIVYAAYSQLGVPYVWGGSTPGKALDCSGLVQYCLRQAGISVPHYSGDIGSGGTKVTSPEPGDVVCYSGHCAIYVGDGKMIEAPHSGAVVRVSSVRSGCWYRRYW